LFRHKTIELYYFEFQKIGTKESILRTTFHNSKIKATQSLMFMVSSNENKTKQVNKDKNGKLFLSENEMFTY
jgi:hypothetical protein